MEIEDLYLQVLLEPIPAQTFLKRMDRETRRSAEGVLKDQFNREMHKESTEHAKINNPVCGIICDLGKTTLRPPRLIIPTFETPTTDEQGIKPAHSGPESFRFNRLDTNPGALNDLFNSLRHYGLIDKESSVRDFKKVFSGAEITNPIIWTGNASEFYWFIHLLYMKYKFVEDLKQQQWKVASKCFVQADGSRFVTSKLRNLKKPGLTWNEIEKAVRLLK